MQGTHIKAPGVYFRGLNNYQRYTFPIQAILTIVLLFPQKVVRVPSYIDFFISTPQDSNKESINKISPDDVA
jgi:hypothetical protein